MGNEVEYMGHTVRAELEHGGRYVRVAVFKDGRRVFNSVTRRRDLWRTSEKEARRWIETGKRSRLNIVNARPVELEN